MAKNTLNNHQILQEIYKIMSFKIIHLNLQVNNQLVYFYRLNLKSYYYAGYIFNIIFLSKYCLFNIMALIKLRSQYHHEFAFQVKVYNLKSESINRLIFLLVISLFKCIKYWLIFKFLKTRHLPFFEIL